MEILQLVAAQIKAVGLPLYAVTLTAIPRADTPLLLMLHWHGFRREGLCPPEKTSLPVPGSALQLNHRWTAVETLDAAVLEAAWHLGAWDIERMERRACNRLGASAQEALECRQAFGDHPLAKGESHLLAEAPDRRDLMHLGAAIGYLRWQFRPAQGSFWRAGANDDTLAEDGSRAPPCPIPPQALRGGRPSRTFCRLGRIQRIITL